MAFGIVTLDIAREFVRIAIGGTTIARAFHRSRTRAAASSRHSPDRTTYPHGAAVPRAPGGAPRRACPHEGAVLKLFLSEPGQLAATGVESDRGASLVGSTKLDGTRGVLAGLSEGQLDLVATVVKQLKRPGAYSSR